VQAYAGTYSIHSGFELDLGDKPAHFLSFVHPFPNNEPLPLVEAGVSDLHYILSQ
jgi:hypothetical protein